jgi:hypothetical protein
MRTRSKTGERKPQLPASRPRRSAAGLSLVELVGALAIIAVMVAVTAPMVVTKVREQWRQSEAATMAEIGKAYQRVVALAKSVPSTNAAEWVPLVASEMGIPADGVWTNRAGAMRLLIYDPAMGINGLAPNQFPYQQGAIGTTNLVNARLVLVSGLQPAYPNVALHTADGFSNLWNRAAHQLPAGWPASWSSDPDDLVVERVDLTGLFHKVVLNNVDWLQTGLYAVLASSLSGSGYAAGVATSSSVATRLIHGTPLRLYYGNGNVQAVEMVITDTSYSHEAGRWNRSPLTGVTGPSTCGPLGFWVEAFMRNTDWGVTANGTSPVSVVLSMFDTLCGTTDWTNTNFENENGHSKWEAPTGRFVFDVCPQLMLSSQDLIDE